MTICNLQTYIGAEEPGCKFCPSLIRIVSNYKHTFMYTLEINPYLENFTFYLTSFYLTIKAAFYKLITKHV